MNWIKCSDHLPQVDEGDAKEIFVTVERAHNGKRYSFTAQYLNQLPLYCDYDDGSVLHSGWYSVKEHADYDGWYEPLIDESTGDKVVAWMEVPAPYQGEE